MADVAIVGGGPAGTATGALLAMQGFEVVLLDRARFPRDKPCGEFLTPGAVALLNQLGVWRDVAAAGAWPVRRAAFRAPSGAAATYQPPDGEPAGWAVRRVALDAALLRHARTCGVDVREGVHVRGLLRDGNTAAGVQCAGPGRDGRHTLPASLVVGADGATSLVARELGVVRPLRRLQRLAVVTHWRGAPETDAIEMHFHGRLVCGYGPLGGGEANVTLVVPQSEAPRMAGRAGGYGEERIRAAFPDLWARLAGAEREPDVSTVGCFGHVCRRASAPGALLVGDSAAFVDPFTGEGVYHALCGAHLAAEVAGQALRAGDLSAERLAAYDRARGELQRRHVLCGIVQAVVRTPVLLERAVRRLSRHPALTHRLLAVLGDIRPPSDALCAGMAWRLLVAG